MTPNHISRSEVVLLYSTFGLLIFGIVISRLDRFWFDFTYAREDGFIEWLTVLALLCIFIVSGKRLLNLYKKRNFIFLFSLVVLMGLSFFAAGEELSWGQRLLKVKSAEFFVQHNSQKEINFHNLIVAGKSVNLLVFSRLLILVMAGYMVLLPVLYKRKSNIKKIIDSLAVPVPKVYQIIALLLIFGLISLCPSGKRAELLEFGTCYIFLIIVLFPQNAEIFSNNLQAD